MATKKNKKAVAKATESTAEAAAESPEKPAKTSTARMPVYSR